jgi:hypothetical protein
LDLGDLLVRHETFEQLRDIVSASPRTRAPGYFVNWLMTNYVTAATVGIRRLRDERSSGGSLGRLLLELIEHPEVKVGSGRRIGRREIRADRRELLRATGTIKRLVDKRVAHADKPGSMRRLPTYNDLDDAFQVLDRLVCKYAALMAGDGLVTCKPTRNYDWYKVLLIPWLVPPTQGGPQIRLSPWGPKAPRS